LHAPPMTPRAAFLSKGRLHVLDGGAARELRSPFAQQVIDRTLRMHEKNAWKVRDGEEGMFSGRMLWGAQPANADAVPVFLRSATRGQNGRDLAYLLETDSIGGLFESDTTGDDELRIFHKEYFRARDLDRHPVTGRLACAVLSPNGNSHIAVANAEGRQMREITEGDSTDLAPSWARNAEETLLYQSAGIGRDASGNRFGLAPFTIERLDLDSGRAGTVLSEPGSDLLQPRMDAEGNLFFIRRPYEAPGAAKVSPGKVLLDVALFPYRLLRAVVHFLNLFSMMFSKKPLMTSTGQKMAPETSTRILLWGRMIDARKALESAGNGEASLAPPDWVLVKRPPTGSEEVLQRGVVAFDLARDGTVVCTNGFSIWHLSGGERRALGSGSMIESVAALD
jgi:hypothetical protein